MLCPRCNTELPDSASVCAQCGSPVYAAASVQSQASNFSYLPTGTPQWPTTASPQLPYTLTGQAQKPVASAPSASSDQLETTPAKRRKAGALGVPFVLLLLFASILVGGGLTYGVLALQSLGKSPQPAHLITLTPPASATPAPSSTPGAAVSPTPSTAGNQLPTPVSFQHGVSTDLGFTMQFPSGWTQGQTSQDSYGNKGVVFRPTAQLPVSLVILQFSATNSAQISSTSDINTGNIDNFGTSNNLSSPQVLNNTPTKRTIGGLSWDEEDAVYTSTGGSTAASFHVVTLAVKHNAYYYNILFFAPSSAYDEAMTKYYSKMLDSFQFTS